MKIIVTGTSKDTGVKWNDKVLRNIEAVTSGMAEAL